MKSRRTALVFAVLAVVLLVSLSACATIILPFPSQSSGGSKGGGPKVDHQPKKQLTFPAIANNSTVRLEAGDYVGDLTIRANKVTIIGRGAGATRILGRVTILGNNCTISQLTIAGPVAISGNNADLRGARVEGKVSSSGKNNAW